MFRFLNSCFFTTSELVYFKAAEDGNLAVIKQYFLNNKSIANLAKSRNWYQSNDFDLGPYKPDLDGTILGIAAKAKHTEIVIFLLANLDNFFGNEKPSRKTIYSYIFNRAIMTKNVDLVRYLLNNNYVSVNDCFERFTDEGKHILRKSPLYKACESKAVDIIKLLLAVKGLKADNGLHGSLFESDVSDGPTSYHVTYYDKTPFQLAKEMGRKDIQELILSYYPDARTDEEYSPKSSCLIM